MFLKTLRLTNFRCFKELEVSFGSSQENRRRTLILGENGTGKSNILKSIALVTAGSDALGELIGSPDAWIRYGAKTCRIDLEITTQKGEPREISLEMHRKDSLSDVMMRSTSSLQQIDEALHHADRNYFVVGYGASRVMPVRGSRGSYSPYESRRAQCIASLLDKQAPLQSLEEWAIDLDYRKQRKGIEIVRRVFDEFLPDIKFRRIDKRARQLILATSDGLVPLEALSDGYQNMASWMGDLLFRISTIFRDRRNPLSSRGVLLLDEVDLHLHPAWQRRLLEDITATFPNMQLVATSHSPFTAQQAGEGELFTLERDSAGLQLHVYDGKPKELLLHQIIMSDIFGMETDESVHVENLKKNHDRLSGKSRKSKKDKQKLEKIQKELANIPVCSYGNSLISDEDRKISLEVLRMYNAKRMG